uniref:Uncharacterized protein n=1 Tax=Candidatus Methanogaster sp. ANME-2c ERB4 TaxID=2759911 RepID=A0A7G9Y106_9EURY|nr:hypothetical protein KBHNNLIF_00001 [Methanosarcinales archaeon ANME-2c ERB4]
MIIASMLYFSRRVIRKQGIPKSIPIQILASVIAPVVTSKIWSADYIRSLSSFYVPGIGEISISVVRVIEVVVVDEVGGIPHKDAEVV